MGLLTHLNCLTGVLSVMCEKRVQMRFTVPQLIVLVMGNVMKNIIDKIILLLSLALTFTLFAVLSYREPISFEGYEFDGYTPKDFEVELPQIDRTIKPNRMIAYNEHVLKGCYLDTVYITGAKVRIWGGERYYVTAYCPWECGFNGNNYPAGWRTASGEICHRADWGNRYTEPTTVAVDMSYHRFGDVFYIAEFDRVFIAEDNGPGVRGKHLDIFYESWEEMASFPTGYYTVYSVEVSEYCVRASDYDVREYINAYQRNSIQL